MWSRKYANLVLYKCESCTTFLLLILRSSVSLSALDPQSFCSRNIQTHATWGTRPSLSDCRKNEHTDSQKFSELIEFDCGLPYMVGYHLVSSLVGAFFRSCCFLLAAWEERNRCLTVWDPRRRSRGGADALPSFQWEGTDACQGDLNGGWLDTHTCLHV